jgi:hypothetical protein
MTRIGRILRDNIWQFVGVIVSVVAILVACRISSLEREARELRVIILANTSLVEVEQGIADDIRIIYKDRSVSDLSLVEVQLENIGNRAIRSEDYAKPITFVFPEQSKVVEAAIIESTPCDLGISIQSDQNTATLSPVLINPGDRVIARFLAANVPVGDSAPPFTVDARIAEVTDIQIVTAIEASWFADLPGLWLGVFIGVSGFALVAYLVFKVEVWRGKVPAMAFVKGILVFACIVCLVIELLRPGTLLLVLRTLIP